MPDLVVGGLVRFTRDDGATIGVVVATDPSRTQVKWDDPELPTLFVTKDAPLDRVDLPPMVVRASTGEPGLLVELKSENPPKWTVQTLNGVKTVPEADLRPNLDLDPGLKLANGELGSKKRFVLALATRLYLIRHLHDDLVSLAASRVDLKPHQVSVVHRVVSSYPHRFLLCDEVGLGKTIEAGMILKELRARDQGRRCLIIVPASLQRQWQFELKTKFNETFAILNSATAKHVEATEAPGTNPFHRYDSVIVSESWITGKKWAEFARQVAWDMIIVDEAHHVRANRAGQKRTRLFQLMQDLAAPDHLASRAMLFLTATPMQLEEYELYALVDLLDPALFPTDEHFRRAKSETPGLNLLVEQLSEIGFPIDGEDPEETVARVSRWLAIDERLAAKRLSAGPEEVATVCADLSERHLLSEILIRNRKKNVGGFMPRSASRWPVQLTDDERRALARVEDYVAHGYAQAEKTNDNAVGFVMVIFQKLMASSIRALRTSLEGRRQRLLAKTSPLKTTVTQLESLLDDDADATDVVATGSASKAEIAELEELVDLLDGIEHDSKAEKLLAELEGLFAEDPDGKVLIFTEFRETQRHLAELMTERAEASGSAWGIHFFHGQLNPFEKDRSVERFRDGTGPQILISTEAGGEGRNFQFCHVLVNYDLPWNPMRIEQRIGRVDRIGQEHPVEVFNLYTEGTIEERVLDVLEQRIDAFEQTVGGLDPILGTTEKSIREALRQAPAEREQALEALGEKLEKQVAAARDADMKLRDFIMDTKSFSKEIAAKITGRESPVSPEQQERFMLGLLREERTYVKSLGDEYELTFHDPFRKAHEYEFFLEGPKKWAVFRPDAVRDSQHIEYMAFGHEIIDSIVQEVLSPHFEGVTGSWRLSAGDEFSAAAGWLFVHVLNVPGIRPRQELVPVFVSDEGEVSLPVGRALLERAARLEQHDGVEIAASEFTVDSVGELQGVAEDEVERVRQEIEDEARASAGERVDQELAKVTKYFEYRRLAAADKLEATMATVNRLRNSSESGDKKILPVWERNLELAEELVLELAAARDRRLAEIEQHRHPYVDQQLVAAGRIEIVEELA